MCGLKSRAKNVFLQERFSVHVTELPSIILWIGGNAFYYLVQVTDFPT